MRTVAKAFGLLLFWTLGLVLGLTWFVHGIQGYPKCEGVGPGGSCAFSSARGTIRVPYEDLEQFDLLSFVLGSVALLVVAGSMWVVGSDLLDAWRGRRSKRSVDEV